VSFFGEFNGGAPPAEVVLKCVQRGRVAVVMRAMANFLEQAIDCDDGDDAAKSIQETHGIESDGVTNCVFPTI
jgi:hypothetical protein